MDRRKRLFERRPPSRDAQSIFIFCEGRKREYDYFRFFAEIDSRVNLVVHKLQPNEDNSPKGLLRIANQALSAQLVPGDAVSDLDQEDEVWIIVDSDPDKFDSRKAQILEARSVCARRTNWFVAESNPCFEVWLYLHAEQDNFRFEGDHACKNWKTLVNEAFAGGFDSRKHPLHIAKATLRAKEEYERQERGNPEIGETEVYRLAQRILSILGPKLSG